MKPDPQTVEYVRLLHPQKWNKLTSEQKHQLFDLITDEIVNEKTVNKAYRRLTNEQDSRRQRS